MTENKPVKGSIKIQIKFIFVWGILIGCLLYFLNFLYFFGLFKIFRLFGLIGSFGWSLLYRVTKWPIAILTGIVIAGIMVVFRRVTVLVTKDSVVIKKIGQKVQLSIDDFEGADIKKKMHTIWYIVIVSTKVYLYFRNPNGTKAYRLFGFSDRKLEQVMQYIREQRSNNMPIEEKVEALNPLKEDTPFNDIVISSAQIRHDERKMILRISGIGLILLVFAFIAVLVHVGMEISLIINILFLLCVLFGAVLIQLQHLSRKLMHCPEIIRINKNAMWIGEKCFSYTGISYINMTSPRKENNSIFPVQYWMTVEESEKTFKYWLGSQASFGEYEDFCKTLEQAMLMHADKLRYK